MRSDFLFRFIIITMIIILGSRYVNAACTDQLIMCDKALTARNQEVELYKLGIDYREKELERRYNEIEKLRSADQSVFKNPFVWAALGVILGAYAGARAVR